MSAPNAIRTSANGKALVTDFGEWETDVRYIRADETDRLIADAVAKERERCANVAMDYPVPIGCTKAAIEIAAAISGQS